MIPPELNAKSMVDTARNSEKETIMARNEQNAASNRITACLIEGLEARSMRSATPAVVGYLPDWEATPAMMQTLKNSNFNGITQLNYFSVLPTTDGLLPGTSHNGLTNNATNSSSDSDLSQLDTVVAAAHTAGVKVDIVIGGAGTDSDNLRQVVDAGTATWEAMADSISQFAAQHHIDGVDLDWEPADLTAGETECYGYLINTIKQNNPTLKLSAAVNPEHLDVDDGSSAYVLDQRAVQSLDQVVVMTYDLEIGNVAPIAHSESDMNAWGDYVTSVGGSKSQLLMGLPFYGTNGTTWNNTVGKGYADLINAKGSLPSPTADSMTIGGKTWNYNGPTTIFNKTKFAVDNSFGGVAIWSIGTDYTNNGSYDDTYSLLSQVKKAVGNTTATTPTTPVTPAPTAMLLTGTLLSSSPWYHNNHYTADLAIDGDINTYFDGQTAGTASRPEWIALDFGQARQITQIKYAARADARWTMAGGVFQAANSSDFSDAVNLFSVDATPTAGLHTANVSGTFRFVCYLAPIGSYGNIAEMQVFGTTPATGARAASTSPFAASDQVISLIDDVA
ncbi:MAG: glycoside hydrolase family 18 [Phycisphaerales bacterium]|nr:glycoside hydrolase family 18 [Phycisphaerales bacterium]